MKQFIITNKKYLLYILYFIVLIVGFLYYRFPSDVFKDYFEASAKMASPGLVLSIGDVRPAFPFGLKFIRAELYNKNDPNRAFFMTKRLLIRPKIWSILKGDTKYRFSCGAYQGDLRGSFQVPEKDKKGVINTSIQFEDIRIEDWEYFSAITGNNLKGVLDGTLTYSGRDKSLVEGSGKADLIISAGRIAGLRFLNSGAVGFKELLIQMSLNERKIDLAHVELKGPEIQGTLSGTVALRREFAKSRLHLKGIIEPLAGLFKDNAFAFNALKILKQDLKSKGFAFVIRGTMEEPAFELR
ncbi:MAG: type II secretion system protein GspN [Desulfobacterales bacterium]|nr:type II secretion system protein GspN [Desulfobacterales bacterium]